LNFPCDDEVGSSSDNNFLSESSTEDDESEHDEYFSDENTKLTTLYIFE